VESFLLIAKFMNIKSGILLSAYNKYLTEKVTPKIPDGATVIIHGHPDIIEDEAYNPELSMARATEAMSIIENALAKAGRSDVKFEAYGFGDDHNLAQFANNSPGLYNHAVIIDIIPPI
jgi:outer membrane protein OmpA-like peptidoglycan-associated protein